MGLSSTSKIVFFDGASFLGGDSVSLVCFCGCCCVRGDVRKGAVGMLPVVGVAGGVGSLMAGT